jgi:hypothetical protein
MREGGRRRRTKPKHPPARKTLLEHPADLRGERFGIDPRAPEQILLLANRWLAERSIKTKEAMRGAMMQDTSDRIAHDAAWLRGHCVKGIELIDKLPADLHAEARKLWANAFHAGARTESLTVNLKYLRDVQSADSRRTGRKNRVSSPAKITEATYSEAMKAKPRTRKELFGFLNASGPTVRAFEKQHPALVDPKWRNPAQDFLTMAPRTHRPR